MIPVYIEEDEWFPVFCIRPKCEHTDHTITVSEETAIRWHTVFAAFEAVQEEIKALCRQQVEARIVRIDHSELERLSTAVLATERQHMELARVLTAIYSVGGLSEDAKEILARSQEGLDKVRAEYRDACRLAHQLQASGKP